MTARPARWLIIVAVTTSIVFVGVAAYVYAIAFASWLESDVAVTSVLGARAVAAHSPIVTDWYFANGDIWVLSPHLLAMLPVVLFGPGTTSLWVTTVIGLVLELAVFTAAYRQLDGRHWVAGFAAVVTLIAWSNAHVAYEYIQLAYGWLTALYIVPFSLVAAIATSTTTRRDWVVYLVVMAAVIAVQNPTRAVIYVIAPVLGSCVWPWSDVLRRRRLTIAAAAVAGWIVAYAIYTWVLVPSVELSIPRGHLAFALGGVGHNLVMMKRGLIWLCGGGHLWLRGLGGIIVFTGAITLVVREALAGRAASRLRVVCAIVVTQLIVVLGPLVIGNLLDGREAIRYVMPCLLEVTGLAVIIAIRELDVSASRWRRPASIWLAVIPVAALAVAIDAKPPTPRQYVWPHTAELAQIADELDRRELHRGFAINLGANLLTLDTAGRVHTCPIVFGDVIRPQRWLTDTSCFDPAALPDTFFVVAYRTDPADQAAVKRSLPPPIDHFTVGPVYDVFVFRTADGCVDWLTH